MSAPPVSAVLFKDEEGSPLKFYVKPGETKKTIRPLIEVCWSSSLIISSRSFVFQAGGGELLTKFEHDAIRLINFLSVRA